LGAGLVDRPGLIAILRIDRLREAAQDQVGLIDELMRLLPDRRRLLEGSGLDLYRDFDALLVTARSVGEQPWLAARHHLSEEALQVGLTRAAPAGGRRIEWATKKGRPIGLRTLLPDAPADGDDRLLALPSADVVVLAPPDAVGAVLSGSEPTNAGIAATRGWGQLLTHLTPDDAAVPGGAILVVTLADPPGAGMAAEVFDAAATPRTITLTAGVSKAPFLDVVATFADDDQARIAESQWPRWRERGLALLAIEPGDEPTTFLRRERCSLALHVTVSPGESRRMLEVVAGLTQRHLATMR
jgi:hypothetical protein